MLYSATGLSRKMIIVHDNQVPRRVVLLFFEVMPSFETMCCPADDADESHHALLMLIDAAGAWVSLWMMTPKSEREIKVHLHARLRGSSTLASVHTQHMYQL